MVSEAQKFAVGEIVKVKVKGLLYTQDGFAAGGQTNDEDCILVFEMIDQTTFPSFSDFLGKSSIVRHGDLVTILKHVGRPHSITRDTALFKYDIYEILVSGQVRQAFAQNLEKVQKQ